MVKREGRRGGHPLGCALAVVQVDQDGSNAHGALLRDCSTPIFAGSLMRLLRKVNNCLVVRLPRNPNALRRRAKTDSVLA